MIKLIIDNLIVVLCYSYTWYCYVLLDSVDNARRGGRRTFGRPGEGRHASARAQERWLLLTLQHDRPSATPSLTAAVRSSRSADCTATCLRRLGFGRDGRADCKRGIANAADLVAAAAVELDDVGVELLQTGPVGDGEQRDTKVLRVLVHLALAIHRDRACALVQDGVHEQSVTTLHGHTAASARTWAGDRTVAPWPTSASRHR
jgi:hypothetical protein